MTSRAVTPPSELDLGVSSRQAFGVAYRRPTELETRTRRVLAGSLRLPPHPAWKGNLTDWRADPFGDRNWKFQHHTLRWLNPLRWSALEGDETARREWLRVVYSWYKANLPARRLPGEFAWKDMADGNRAIELSLGAPLVPDSETWFVKLLRAHADWLLNEKNIAVKNHALHQHVGLLVVAATLRDKRAMDVAFERMCQQFRSTFDEEGGNDEGSVGYHELNLRWWEHAWSRVEAEGREVPAFAVRRLEAGREALAQLLLPNGQLPQIGDTKRGLVDLGLGPHVDYVVSGGEAGTPPVGTAVTYKRGYVVSRSGWGQTRPLAEESHLILRHGADLKAHSHQDRGSLHLYTRGRVWLTDSGFHSYQINDPIREHLWSRTAHNVAFLPGVSHEDSALVDLERFTVTPDYHDFIVADRGYESNTVRRRVVYLAGPECWIIQDEAAHASKLMQNWHVDTGITAARHERGFELRSGDNSVSMTWLGQLPRLSRHSALDGDLRGWIGTKWKTLEPGTLIQAESGSGLRPLVLLVAPSAPQEIAIVRSYINTKGDMSAVLMRGPRIWDLRVSASHVSIRELDRSWN